MLHEFCSRTYIVLFFRTHSRYARYGTVGVVLVLVHLLIVCASLCRAQITGHKSPKMLEAYNKPDVESVIAQNNMMLRIAPAPSSTPSTSTVTEAEGRPSAGPSITCSDLTVATSSTPTPTTTSTTPGPTFRAALPPIAPWESPKMMTYMTNLIGGASVAAALAMHAHQNTPS